MSRSEIELPRYPLTSWAAILCQAGRRLPDGSWVLCELAPLHVVPHQARLWRNQQLVDAKWRDSGSLGVRTVEEIEAWSDQQDRIERALEIAKR